MHVLDCNHSLAGGPVQVLTDVNRNFILFSNSTVPLSPLISSYINFKCLNCIAWIIKKTILSILAFFNTCVIYNCRYIFCNIHTFLKPCHLWICLLHTHNLDSVNKKGKTVKECYRLWTLYTFSIKHTRRWSQTLLKTKKKTTLTHHEVFLNIRMNILRQTA